MSTAEFKRLHPHERHPHDAVIVTVRKGLGRMVADVAAVEVIADFPLPVPAALEAAERLRQQAGLSRVAIIIDDGVWRSEWGRLID